MFASLLSVRALLVAIFMLMAGSGFLATLIAIRLEAAGVGALVIGLVATAYFAGLMLGALRVTPLIARVGHIRAFAAFVSVYSASSLTYALIDYWPIWILLRFTDGFVMSGVFVCLESWLNRVAQPNNRSAILAAYMIALYAGQALGIVGVLATGLMLGAFYGLGAVFAQRIGLPLALVAAFTSCVIAGGVVLQYPLGILSDRFDRRRVIVGTMLASAAVCAALVFADGPLAVFVPGALFGGFAFALYPLCVAHANDHLTESERIGASSGLVLVYSAGAVAGPLLGSLAMATLGPDGLFAGIGAVALLAALFGLWRTAIASPVPADEQQAFVGLPRTSPAAAVLESETNDQDA